MTRRRTVFAVTTAVALLLGHTPRTLAAIFSIDTTVDAVDAVIDGTCAIAGGGCSLRAALQESNASPGEDLVSLPAGTYTLTIPGVGDDDGATGDLDVSDAVVIEGAAAATTILDGAQLDRVLDLGADTTIRRLTIRNGDAVTNGESGGGIRCAPFGDGMLVVAEDLVVSDNDGQNGGGIAVEDVTADLVVRRSTFTNNFAAIGGGAIDDDLGGSVLLENVTISDNFGVSGDGVRSQEGMMIVHATVVDDRISGGGIGLKGSLLDNGTIGSCASNTFVTSQGGNLEHGTSCSLGGAGDQSGIDPIILPLADNGGETPTHALATGSPAIDAAGACGLSEDQRGVARPQDGDGTGAVDCDTGAYEAEPGVVPTTTVTTTPSSTTTTTLPTCLIEPSFASAQCRIESLSIRFAAGAEPVKLGTKLGKLLAKAGDRLPRATEALGLGKVKKAKRQVAKSRKFVKRFGKKLGGKKGPKVVVDEALRALLIGDATSLEADLLLLRDGLQ